MKALITGAEGFVGPHLRKELEENGYSVISTGLHNTCDLHLDVLDYANVRSVLHFTQPDFIFHLASVSFVPSSWHDPGLVFKVNSLGTLNLLNAVRSVGINPVIQLAGSSEEYGLVLKDEVPITEDNPLRPLSPYAVSKVAMDLLGYQYFKSYGLKIIRTRAFNHEGYGRPGTFMPSGFARQIVLIEKGKHNQVFTHGDLDSQRDLSDVRDVVHAYRLAVEKCKPGEVYNIGRGKAYSAGEVLNTLLLLSNVKVYRKVDPKLLRPSDPLILLADVSKFVRETGWQVKYSLKETLAEELRYWRENIK